MACTNLACIGDGGCVEPITAGITGQVMTQTINGPVWLTPADTDDQTASEVAFTPTGPIAATTVQAAIVEVVTEICTLIAGCNIEALANVSDVLPTVPGQVLTWDGVAWAPNTPAAAFTCADLATCEIDALANVSSSAATVGQVLTWDGTNWINGNAGTFTCAALETCSLNDLGDVNALVPVVNQVLSFNGVEWVPDTVCGLIPQCPAAAACAVPPTIMGGDGQRYDWAGLDHTSIGARGGLPFVTVPGATVGDPPFSGGFTNVVIMDEEVIVTNPSPCRSMWVQFVVNVTSFIALSADANLNYVLNLYQNGALDYTSIDQSEVGSGQTEDAYNLTAPTAALLAPGEVRTFRITQEIQIYAGTLTNATAAMQYSYIGSTV